MSDQPDPIETARLRRLLHAAHPRPDLPPGFQNAVWRRVERLERPAPAPEDSLETLAQWLTQTAAWLIQPRWAAAGLAAIVLLGTLGGVRAGLAEARSTTHARYLSAVAPHWSHQP
jgi:hypothetical protein